MVLGLPISSAQSAAISALGFNLLKAAVFLIIASIAIRYGSKAVRRSSAKKFEEPVILDLIEDFSRIFMWFWAALITLSILGFSGIAASMGTASGFVALGVAFALSNVISDTVAGVYLAQDSDFNSGDRVETASVEGLIEDVGLRKTRIRLDNGDLTVINNSDVEKKWTKLE